MTDNEKKMDKYILKRATNIVNKIVDDFCDRDGLQNVWDEIDSGVQKQIKNAWVQIVISEM
jgi:hypothetical protein